MTFIEIVENSNGIKAIKCCGHTGYSKSGSDIVCAAVSSIVQTAMLGIEHYSSGKIKAVINEEKALLKINMPDDIDVQLNDKCQIILKTMKLGLVDLAENYSDYINLSVLNHDRRSQND